MQNIDTTGTPEKFLPFAEEIIGFLLNTLQSLDQLEEEIQERSEILSAKRAVSNQIHPEEIDLWKEYARRSKEIIEPISFKPYKDGSRSFGKPTKYAYLGYPGTTISFVMKSAERAVIETRYEYGIAKKEQFILKKGADGWKIDTKKYGFTDEESWYSIGL